MSGATRRLEGWGQVHAGAMLGAAAAALLLGEPRALAGVVLPSFLALLWLGRGRYSADGAPAGASFGVANFVTSVRLAIVVGLLALTRAPDRETALWVAGVFLLDGVDGWLARRAGLSSSFGARFDMECDALLVLAAGVLLAVSGRLGSWIVVPGLLRYLYVLWLGVWPARGEAPRSRLGRLAFGFMVVSLVASLWPLASIHVPLAVVATAVLCASFAHSFAWSLRRR